MTDFPREFLHAVLPHSGLPCIAYKSPTQKGGMRHEVLGTVDAAVSYIETAESTRYDYYFCVSTLRDHFIVDRGSRRVRTQTNTLYTRSFVLDMDVHPDDTTERYYRSQDEAREGLAHLISALEMPKPIVVNSGYGLHVYWPMAEGVPSNQWKSVAERFKAVLLLVEPKAVGDGSRVADSAGVLRVPGTLNLKNWQQAPVSIEQWSDEVIDLGDFSRRMETHGSTTRARSTPTVSLETIPQESEPVELTALVRNCNWSARYLKDADSASEPEWYAMLGLAKYTQHTAADGTVLDGPQIAHLFSKRHPGYAPAETDKKYQQVLSGQTGPTTCARMYSINPAGCAGCPFFGAVKTPLAAARLSRPITAPLSVEAEVHQKDGSVIQQTLAIPVPPKPYFRGQDGGVFARLKEKTEEGTFETVIRKVYDYDLYPIRRFRTESVETEVLEVRLHLPHDGVRTFKLPTELLADKKKMSSFLASRGVIPEFGQITPIAKYMVDYVRSMQVDQAAETEFSRFGWREVKSGDPKFVVGNGFVSKDAALTAGSFAYFLRDAARAVACVGDLAAWKQAFNVYRAVPESEPYQIAALLGFAAPLLALTDYSGVLYNMVGPSGAGKSTALRVMTSVWGQPNESHIRPTDNEIPIYNFIGYLNSIPVAFDELTRMDGDKLGRFVLNFTGGRGKMRATRSGTNAANEVEWDTIIAGTSNTSLYSKLADSRTGYTAEAMRVYEVNVPESHAEHKPRLVAAEAALKQNYGLAGRVFIEWLIPRLGQVEALMTKSMARLDAIGNRRPDERFWVALLAALEVGGTIAKHLGLHDYDVAALVRWGSDQSVEARTEVATSHASPASVLADYFNNTLDGTLYFKSGALDLGNSPFVRTIKTRVEYDGSVMSRAFISVSALREFCKSKSIDFSWLKRGLHTSGVLLSDNISKRLATGTNFPNPNTKSWEIDMTHASLVGEITASV